MREKERRKRKYSMIGSRHYKAEKWVAYSGGLRQNCKATQEGMAMKSLTCQVRRGGGALSHCLSTGVTWFHFCVRRITLIALERKD